MNKKLIVLAVASVMIITGFMVLFNSNTYYSNSNYVTKPNVVYSGFTTYNIPIIYKNYTLPNWDNNFHIDSGDPNVVITKYSPTHTLTAYYWANNELLQYTFNNNKVIDLGTFYYNLPSYNYISALQLSNFSIYSIYSVYTVSSYIWGEVHYLYNNTTVFFNTTALAGETEYSYLMTPYYFYVSYMITPSHATLYNEFVNLTNYNIQSMNFYLKSWTSFVYSSIGNFFFSQCNNWYTNDTVNYTIIYYNNTLKEFTHFNFFSTPDSAIVGPDENAMPEFATLLSNGTLEIYELDQANAGEESYFVSILFEKNFEFKSLSIGSYSMGPSAFAPSLFYTANEYGLMGGAFASGNINTKYQSPFIDILNNTELLTNSSWFNNYFTKNGVGYDLNNNYNNTTDYFGYSGWENYVIDQNTGHVMVFYNPNKVNEFSPSYNVIVNKKYNVNIKENGLPIGTKWSFVYNGTSEILTNNSYNFRESNGNYSLSVSSINGYTVSYPTTVRVDGSNVIAYVNFTAIPKYTVVIKENGLPTNTQWNFTIKQSGNTIIAQKLSNTSYNIALANGSYDLYAGSISGYNLNIHSSSFTVAGAGETEYVNYSTIPTYTLFLKESGLANGVKWIAYVGGNEYESTNAYINVSGLTNGTYTLSIDNVIDYSLGSYPASFTLSGNNYYINITFTHNTTLYQVKFIADHIANVNTISWSIDFNGTKYSSQNSNTIIVPSLKNGSYSLVVNGISGYVVDKYPSSIVISGSNITQYLYFNETFSVTLNVIGYSGQYTYVFNGSTHTIAGNTVINGLINYTYAFSVDAVSGYNIVYTSPIVVNGNNIKENITFNAITVTKGEYTVTIIIVGMSPDTSWSITINNEQFYSNHYELNISLPNGTYYPNIIVPQEYTLSDNSALVVNGNNTIYFATASKTTFGTVVDYMPYFTVFAFIIGLLALVVAVKRR